MATIEELESRLEAIQLEIEECDRRLPAHSVKPGMMEEMMGLEDERDQILSELRELKKKA